MDLVTPGGRLIEGSMSVPSLKDYEGNLRDKPQYYFALAVDKRDPSVAVVLAQIWNAATSFYAQIPDVMRRINMGLDPYSRFAWKISDGDHPKFADKPLYKGHYVFKFSTTIPLKVCGRDNMFMEPSTVKLGWYADVAFSIKPNARIDGNAGMFANPNMVRILGAGEEIITGPAPEKLFGGAPAPQMGTPVGSVSPGIGIGGSNATPPLSVTTAAPMSAIPPASGFGGMANASMSVPSASPINVPLAPADPVSDLVAQGAATSGFVPIAPTTLSDNASTTASPSNYTPPSIPGFSHGVEE